jgi:formylglycine-generating enzyme required for sulfatase activity
MRPKAVSTPAVLLIAMCVSAFAIIPGDFEPDGDVDFDDFSVLAQAWLAQSGEPGWNAACDISDPPDNVINALDLAVFAECWLSYGLPDLPADMVHIHGGEFEMGDHYGVGTTNESPVHRVHVDSFYMSCYELTNQQYCDYLNSAKSVGLIEVRDDVVYAVGQTNRYFCTYVSWSSSQIDYSDGVFSVRIRDGYDMGTHPVVDISWYGAAAYCNWRSQEEGYEQCYDLSSWECDFSKKGYRLPTEAEWEYAARGGCHDPYYQYPWCSNNMDCNEANHLFAEYCNPLGLSLEPYTSPVGYYSANGYGLYDMAGNVWEWCNDWFGCDYYASSSYDNPTGPSVEIYRVVRGGSWKGLASYCRVANRNRVEPVNLGNGIGFRLVLDLQ